MDKTLFQSIFESSAEGILVVDEKGKIIKANKASELVFAYNQGELQSLEVEDLIPLKYRDIHREHRKNYAKNPVLRHSEKFTALWGLKKDGTKFPMEISLSPTTFNGKNLTIAFLRDVSNKTEANNALLESERKLQSLIGNLPGFVYCTKNDKNYTAEYLSENCQKITGYKDTEFLNHKVCLGQIIFEKDRKYVWDTIQKAIKYKKAFSLQYRIITKTGEIKYLWEQGKGLFDSSDNVVALEGFIQDISDRVLLDKTIKRKQARNKALLDALPDMVFVMDAKGKFLDVHAVDHQKLTIPIDEIIGKNLKEALPPKVYKKVYSAVKDTIKHKRTNTVEYALEVHKNNYYFESRFVPLNNQKVLTIARDITHKKDIENKLEIRNRALGAAGNGILIVKAQQPDFPIIYTNTAFTEITGYKQSEVLGKNCRFLQCDDRDQEAVQIMKNAIKEGSSCEVVLRNYKKDGTLFYNEVTITPVYNDQQKLTHFIGVQNDVTNRKIEDIIKNQMRNALEMIAQEQPLGLVANTLIEIAENHIKDSLGAVLLVNKESNSIHQSVGSNLPILLKEMVEGKVISENLCPCASAAFYKKEIIIEDLANNLQWKDNKTLALKHGLKSSWSFPVMSSNDDVLGVFTLYGKQSKSPTESEKDLIYSIINLLSIGIEQETVRNELFQSRKKLAAYAQDLEEKIKDRTDDLKATVQKLVETNLSLEDQIIETKLAERKALDNQALFSAIAKNFPKGAISVVDASYNLIFIDGNELSNLGISNKDLENTPIDKIDLLNNDQKNFIKKSIKNTLAGKHLSFEIKFRGHTYTVNTTPFYDEDKKINKALFVFNNISEHKQVELDILNALRKEQELNELKSRFVSMASHEFRTPLSTILSSATLIERQNETGKEAKRLNYVSRIKSNVKDMVNILNDFLSLSRLEDSKLSIEPETFDLIDFSKTIIKEIGLNKKDGQTIELNCDKDKFEIFQDPRVTRMIFNNLLSNAIKYSSENKKIEITIESNNGYVHLWFKDQGIGIPLEDHHQLFDRFFRSRNANHIQGTGLGLYIVKQYVGLIGGKINFKNNEHEGTTFFVEFPIKNS